MSGYEWEFEQRDDGDPGLPVVVGRTLDGREVAVRIYEDTRGCVAVSVESDSEVTVSLRLENGGRVIEETDYEFAAARKRRARDRGDRLRVRGGRGLARLLTPPFGVPGSPAVTNS